MARRKKSVDTPAPTKFNGRRRKNAANSEARTTGSAANTATAKVPDVPKLEAELIARYPQARILNGSYRLAGDPDDGWKKKATVVIECCVCDAKRRIATSDLWQTVTCSDECRKDHKKMAKESQSAEEAAK